MTKNVINIVNNQIYIKTNGILGPDAQAPIYISLNHMRKSGCGPLDPCISRAGSTSHFYAARISKTKLFGPQVTLWASQGPPGDPLRSPKEPLGPPRDSQGLPMDPPWTSQDPPRTAGDTQGPCEAPQGPHGPPLGTLRELPKTPREPPSTPQGRYLYKKCTWILGCLS